MKRFFYVRLDGMKTAVADVSAADFGCDLAADKIYEINRINVPEPYRGQGIGAELLKEVLAEADKDGATLRLHAHGSGRLTTPQLVRWYKRHGFKPSPTGYLVRKPEVTV